MPNVPNTFVDLITACWKDDVLKARLMADPRNVLAECGIEFPDGMKVTVVENDDNTMHITLPMAPEGHHELSDEELADAAGGYLVGMAMIQKPQKVGFINSMAS
jgi:hypothetical protein